MRPKPETLSTIRMLAMLSSMHQCQAIMAVVRLAAVVAAAGVTQELQQQQAHNFTIDATSVTHTVTTRHMGCHLDSGFGEELLALHSNIVFSPSFEFGDPTQKPANVTEHPVGVGWVTVREAAEGTVSMTPDALHGHSALEVQYKGGTGQLGVANRGIGNEGLFLTGQKVYEGYLFARSASGSGASAVLHVALQNFETGATLATQQLTIPAGSNWTRYNLSLTPSADTLQRHRGTRPKRGCNSRPSHVGPSHLRMVETWHRWRPVGPRLCQVRRAALRGTRHARGCGCGLCIFGAGRMGALQRATGAQTDGRSARGDGCEALSCGRHRCPVSVLAGLAWATLGADADGVAQQ